MEGKFTTLKKKYHDAKKRIKQYRAREKDLLQEIDVLRQQVTEKDKQYNTAALYLQSRILLLEGIINEAHREAGLSCLTPDKSQPDQSQRIHITRETSIDTESFKDNYTKSSINSQLAQDKSDAALLDKTGNRCEGRLVNSGGQTSRHSKSERNGRITNGPKASKSLSSRYQEANTERKIPSSPHEMDDSQDSHSPTEELPQPLQKVTTHNRFNSNGTLMAEDIYEMFGTSDDWSNDDHSAELISISD